MMLFVVIIGQEKREKKKKKIIRIQEERKRKSNEFSIKDLNTRKPIFFFSKNSTNWLWIEKPVEKDVSYVKDVDIRTKKKKEYRRYIEKQSNVIENLFNLILWKT